MTTSSWSTKWLIADEDIAPVQIDERALAAAVAAAIEIRILVDVYGLLAGVSSQLLEQAQLPGTVLRVHDDKCLITHEYSN